MIKDSKGKKISREELTKIYQDYVLGERNDDYGKYLTYDGDDEQTIDSVKEVNRKRSPKDSYGNYSERYLGFLQQEAYKLAGNRKFARVMRLTFDPDFYAESKQPYLSMPFGEWLGYYELGREHNLIGVKKEDKEFNDKVERFAQAYKIKIPESNVKYAKGGNIKSAKAKIGSIEYNKYEGYFIVELVGDYLDVGKMDVQFNFPSGKFFYSNPDDKYFEYARIGHSEISESYRGSGHYVKMIKKAVEKAVELGFKGIVSLYDGEYEEERSSDANISWLTMSDPVYARNNGLKITPSEKNYQYAHYYVELDPNSNSKVDAKELKMNIGGKVDEIIYSKFDEGGEISKNIDSQLKKIGFTFNTANYRYGKNVDERTYISAFYDKNKQLYKIGGVKKFKTPLGGNSVGIKFEYDNKKEFWQKINEFTSTNNPDIRFDKGGKVDAKELKMVKGGNVSSISYEDWKKAYIYLNNEVDEKSLLLNKYPTNPSGLIEEKVRMSEEYQKVKKDFDKSFKKLQDFNKVSPKQYQKRYHKEKRARWRMNIGGKVEKIEEMKDIQTKGDMGDKVKFLKENPEIFMGKVFSKGGKSRTLQDVIADINKLNEQSRSGKIAYAPYYKAYEKLRKEAEAIKRYNSFPQQMKRFGASVKKADGYTSVYYYIGKNFDGVIFEDCCELCWWQVYTIDIMKDGEFEKKFGRKPRLQGLIEFIMEDQENFDTKKEVIHSLYAFDQEFDDQEVFIKNYGDSWKDGKNFAKGGYITEGDKQSDYSSLYNEDKLKYIQKEIGTINGLKIITFYEEFEDRSSDEEFVVVFDDPMGNEIEIKIEFRLLRDENNYATRISHIKFTRSIFNFQGTNHNVLYYASAEYENDYDFNRAYEYLKDKGEYIFNTIEDFNKYMRLIQLEREVKGTGNKDSKGKELPIPINKKLVVTKDTPYYDLPNTKSIIKEIKKRFNKAYSNSIDEYFANQNDKQIITKPYIFSKEKYEGKDLSNIKENNFDTDLVDIYLSYKEQNADIYAKSFAIIGTATYLKNGQFYKVDLNVIDTTWFNKKQQKLKLKDYSTDQKEIIAFLRKELKKTKKLI